MKPISILETPKIHTITPSTYLAIVPKQPLSFVSLEEKVTSLLVNDLIRLGWRLKPNSNDTFEFAPPTTYEKDIIRTAMSYARNDVLNQNQDWIIKHLPMARNNLALGKDVLSSPILPRIEVCETSKQHNLFRLFRYYWSSPFSEYVGRRMRLLIRDDGIQGSPVIGIAALGSSIIHIPDRDNWIGWDKETRTNRIIYVMDAYVLGALPPYNHLLGGKLISYILASNELRELYKQKYADKKTLILGRQANDLALIITTSLYGQNSSQYNRIKYNDELLYKPIGTTAGFGTLHISNNTFEAMKSLLHANGISISYKFGDGPNWRMRVIRKACSLLGLDGEIILNHSFQRGLFAIPLAENWQSFLLGEDNTIEYKNMPMNELVNYWKQRWLTQRMTQQEIISRVSSFTPSEFNIETTPLIDNGEFRKPLLHIAE